MSASRRIANELRLSWTESWQSANSIFITDTQPRKISFYIFFETNYEPLLVKLDFTNKPYPFKPPRVSIGIAEKDYISLLPTSWSFQDKILGTKCLCCNSILCKWGPNKTIMDILNEVKENFILKIRMMEIAHCRKIVEKKIKINYLPIEEFL